MYIPSYIHIHGNYTTCMEAIHIINIYVRMYSYCLLSTKGYSLKVDADTKIGHVSNVKDIGCNLYIADPVIRV